MKPETIQRILAEGGFDDMQVASLSTVFAEAFDRMATKEDLRVLRAELRADLQTEIQGLRTEIHEAIHGVHAEIQGLRTEMHETIHGVQGEIQGLRTEMQSEIQGLRTEMQSEIQGLRTEMQQLKATMTWRMLAMVAALAALLSAVEFIAS